MDIGQLNYNKAIPINSRIPLVLKELSKCILEDNPPLEFIYRYCANTFATWVGEDEAFAIPVNRKSIDRDQDTAALARTIEMISQTATDAIEKKKKEEEEEITAFRMRKMQKEMARMKRRQDQEMQDSLEQSKREALEFEMAQQRLLEAEEKRKQKIADIRAMDEQQMAGTQGTK